MLEFSKELKLSSDNNFYTPKITYTAMTIFHIFCKWQNGKLLEEENTTPFEKFDCKLILLSCLRISAVLYDCELRQDMYTKVYYESCVNDDNFYVKKLRDYHKSNIMANANGGKAGPDSPMSPFDASYNR